jgi:serine protease Do
MFLAVPLLAVSVTASANAHQGPNGSPARMLGVGVSEISPSDLSARGLDHGVRIQMVAPGSPAAAAGLKTGDILVEIGGKAVYSLERLQWLVGKASAGESTPVKLLRGDTLETAAVSFPVANAPTGETGDAPSKASGWPVLGLLVQPLTPDLRAAFGAPEGSGVLVREVMEQGPAAKAGITAGDIIVRIDRRVAQSPQDVYRALGFFDPGASVDIEVIRDRRSKVVTATLGSAQQQRPGHGRGCGPHGHPMMGPYGWQLPWHGYP